MSFADRMADYRDRVDAALESWLPGAGVEPRRLHEALRYSVLGGGKRLRPLLTYAAGEVLDLEPRLLDPIAVAVEMIHAYSLVHDDLPAMDDDSLRRGRATTHVAFDEATAILVGDTLQSLAFSVLANDSAYADKPDVSVRLVRCLAEASGASGMVGGQSLDLASEGAALDTAALEDLYSKKTGALIRASLIMPSYCKPDLSERESEALETFAKLVGLAFQVQDDVLDIEGSTETIGKPQGSDIRNDKATYPSIVGLDQAKARADGLYSDAIEQLQFVGSHTESLRWLSAYIVQRQH